MKELEKCSMALPWCNEVSNHEYVILIILIVGLSSFKSCFTDINGVGGRFFVDPSLSIVMISTKSV